MRRINFSEICGEEWEDEKKPLIDRRLSMEQIRSLTHNQRMFSANGILHMPKFIPDDLIEQYCELRKKLDAPGGWNMPCPYLHFQEIKNISLYRPMMMVMEELLGNPMGLHLNLTGWTSTQRNWHQDDYLNPDFVAANYIAVWIALDDIHPDSGPFQYVRSSNVWPCIRQEKVFEIMEKEQGVSRSDPLWPTKTQDWIAEACEAEIERRSAVVSNYLPKKGDVLFWHGRLLHRGSVPKNPDLQRKALICHYSSVRHRPDFKKQVFYRTNDGVSEGYYFDTGLPLEGPQRV